MLRAIKRAHAGVRFDPNAEVFQHQPATIAGGGQLLDVAPIHRDEHDRAVSEEWKKGSKSFAEESENCSRVISPLAMANSACCVRPRPLTWPSMRTLYGGSVKTAATRRPEVNRRNKSLSRASPQAIRCRPARQTSPTSVTSPAFGIRSLAATSSTASQAARRSTMPYRSRPCRSP